MNVALRCLFLAAACLAAGCGTATLPSKSSDPNTNVAEPFRRKPPMGCTPEEVETTDYCEVCSAANPRECSDLCRSGNGGACYVEGLILEMVRHEDASAVDMYERGCSRGSGASCEVYARMLIMVKCG